ncbi:MAG TPA: signal peptide peptidase SppA [Methanoculleus sp.]|nr:signal peptide peptidase SppA [Methanoculleus sp.]
MRWLERECQNIELRKERRKERKACRRYFVLGFLVAILIFAIAGVWYVTMGEIRTSVIRVEGTIVAGDGHGGGYVGSEYVGRQIRSAADDPLVRAIVLRVNSAGGSPAAAQEIITDIEYAKEKKPVFVSMGDIATSAAYHISAHADRIYANPDTMTGSIGTIWLVYDYSRALDEEGIEVEVVKSGDLKDIASSYRTLTDEEREYLQAIVDESSELFIEDIVAERGIDRSLIDDARPLRGEEALRIGLVDEIGNLFETVSAAGSFAPS